MEEQREDLKPSRRRYKLFQLRWKEPMGKPECPYAYRWVLNLGICALRLHHWIRSDDKRYFHDHPYSFITIILKGSYTDVSPSDPPMVSCIYKPYPKNGRYAFINNQTCLLQTLTAGMIKFRKAEFAHYVDVPEGGCWSFLISGPQRRNWGFWVKGKLKRPLKYFHEYGHPPCDEQ